MSDEAAGPTPAQLEEYLGGTRLRPFAHTDGPLAARIAIVGEAWGKQESYWGRPFKGSAGHLLNELLLEAEIARKDCFLTNVFNFQPPGNLMLPLLVGKKALSPGYTLPQFQRGKYLPDSLLPHLERLRTELEAVKPNVVIALGACASWALLQTSAIGSVRGVATEGILGLKVLPTYHPAAVLRMWEHKPVVMADLLKAKREAEYPEVRRTARTVTYDATLDEIRAFVAKRATYSRLGVDIETAFGQITCIGFAPSISEALVVSFVKNGRSYWSSASDEAEAWGLVQTLLEDTTCPKLFQNGMYDLQWLYRLGFRPKNCGLDTMLFHHALYSEMPKSLGFLGSIYSNEAAWKLARRSNHEEKPNE